MCVDVVCSMHLHFADFEEYETKTRDIFLYNNINL